MRSRGLAFAVLALCGFCRFGDAAQAQRGATGAAQTARQALLEMFFSKSAGTFVKHLPHATRTALEQSGALNMLDQYAALGGQMESQQKNLQTFETGSVFLSAQNPMTSDKFEVIVENDALRGDSDDIELSFHTYKNGEAQKTPYMPQMTFSMMQESGLWKLNEISITIHLPLADPDFLKGITTALKARAAASTMGARPATQSATSSGGSEASVVAALHTIVTAENTYAATYRNIGYTCALMELDGFGGGERNEHQAMLINAGLAGGKRYGYVFTVSQCAGASGFQLTAAPNSNNFGQRAYCTDQTSMVRYSADGNAASCMKNGIPLP
jgi:hypothetical protein